LKILIVVLLALATVLARPGHGNPKLQADFKAWMTKHSKNYTPKDLAAKFRTFSTNLAFIDAHNKKNLSFSVALNEFADLTGEEFNKLYNGLRVPQNYVHASPVFPNDKVTAPGAQDWRAKGAVTGIKNQGQCGSCWSFSTTGSTEGCHEIKSGNLVSLSEQNLMDCSTSYGNNACNGGLMTQAMQYIIANGGIDTEASYPYTAEDQPTCQYTAANRGAGLKSFSNIASGSESGLEQAGASGPVSVAIDASHSSFQFYSSGVYYEPACSPTQLDHGVLMVGWGTTQGTYPQYWIVKNSWGTSWGQNGYIWMARNQNNNCGIATMATIPSC